MSLDERRRLFKRHVTDDGEDDLIGKILFGVEGLHIRQGDFVLTCPPSRCTGQR